MNRRARGGISWRLKNYQSQDQIFTTPSKPLSEEEKLFEDIEDLTNADIEIKHDAPQNEEEKVFRFTIGTADKQFYGRFIHDARIDSLEPVIIPPDGLLIELRWKGTIKDDRPVYHQLFRAIDAEIILKSLGNAVEVKERMIDLVTAVSGSGPAYFFFLVEKMIEAAYESGMKLDTAKRLVYQTALGSAKILAQGDEDPDVLIGRVASKGGTTEAALKVFRRKGFGKIINDAVKAAYKRSKELSES